MWHPCASPASSALLLLLQFVTQHTALMSLSDVSNKYEDGVRLDETEIAHVLREVRPDRKNVCFCFLFVCACRCAVGRAWVRRVG